MKKIALGAVITLALAASVTPFVASAKDIKTVSANYEGGKIAVSGTAETGTLAVAVMVYDEKGAELLAMQTASVSDESLYYSEIELAEGNYIVKVADYDGGNFKTATVTAAKAVPGAPNSGAI